INTGSNFEKMSLRPQSFNMKAFNIGTMVDFDNNGDLDLFLSDYTGKLVIALNVNGNFKSSNMWHFEMPKTKSFSFLNALAFHDLDGDSDLDAILGVYSVNSNELHSNPDSQNLVLINKGHESELKLITHDIPGETMSLLIKDLNGDNKPELIIGNDFNVPDLSFLSINENIVTQRPDHNFISMSSKSTMSIIAGDINNDLKEELFFTDMGHYDNYLNDPCHSSMNEQERKSCSNILNAYKSAQNPEFDCSTLSTQWLRYPCYTTNLRFGADKFRRFDICDILKDGTAEKYHCMTNKKNQIEFQENYFDVVKTPRQKASNVLLSYNEDMKVDLAQKHQIQNTYWGWNSAFFDFDNDSLLDLYVVNGEGVNSKSTPNILFRNTGDRFNKVEEEVIDQNFGHTKTFTLFDYNNDGNIDFVEQSELLNLRLYQNNHSGRKKVIRLRDFVGNRFCIGCSVVASYRSGKKVKRSVVLGGGFRSFHNTDLHFGIPEDDDIISFKVNWSLGQKDSFNVKSNNKVLNTFINQ
ncbi:MAG: CRTAC1 family protein, partial [Bacteriovoracaceae bacterium]|nr:CRTAC1 family protein [Bacteriovoracaceae bacterium]